MLTIAFIFMIFLRGIQSLLFKTKYFPPDTNLPLDHYRYIEKATKSDRYLKSYKISKLLGYGGYGVAFLAIKRQRYAHENIPSMVALKVSKDSLLDRIPKTPNENDLMEHSSGHSVLYRNMRMIKYLKSKRVPFVQTIQSFRQIIYLSEDLQIPQVYSLVSMDYGDKDNLLNFVEQYVELLPKSIEKVGRFKIRHDDGNLDTKMSLFKDILYVVLVSIHEMNKHGVIHGDIKPENIFMRRCELTSSKVCPIVGDWDLSYYYRRTKNDENYLRYTTNFRPPEMHYFSADGIYMIPEPYGYKYSGKEDVFALGMSMVEICFKMGLLRSPSVELDDILTGMIAPLTLPEAIEVLTTDSYHYVLQKRFTITVTNVIKSTFDQKERKIIHHVLHKLATYIHNLTKDSKDLRDFMKFYNNAGSFLKDSYVIKMSLIDRILPNEELMAVVQYSLPKYQADVFYNFYRLFKQLDPLTLMMQDRLTAEDALYRFLALFRAELPYEDHKSELAKDIKFYQFYDDVNFNFKIPEKSIIIHQNIKHVDISNDSIIRRSDCPMIYDNTMHDRCSEELAKSLVSFECLCWNYPPSNIDKI